MFHHIRRILILGFWALLVGVAFWIYQRRAVLQPAVDWVEVLKNRKSVEQVFQGQVAGTVTKVLDGDTFQMRDPLGQTYTVSLVGVAAPTFWRDMPKPLKALASHSKSNLSNLILSNRVTVDVTFTAPQNNVLGFARLAETNLNVAVAESGWGEVKRDFIRTLPPADQVALIQAERHAQEAKRGLWAEDQRAEANP